MSKGGGDESYLKKLEAHDIKNRHDLYASIAEDYVNHRNAGTPEESFIFQRRYPRGEYGNLKSCSGTVFWIGDWLGKKGIKMSDIDSETDKADKTADKGGASKKDIKPKDTKEADKDQVAMLHSFLEYLEGQGMPQNGNGEASSDTVSSAGTGDYYANALDKRLEAASDLYYFLNCEDEEGTEPSIKKIRNNIRFSATACFLPICFDGLSGAGLYIIGSGNLDYDMKAIDGIKEKDGRSTPTFIRLEDENLNCFACIIWTKYAGASFIKYEDGYEWDTVQCMEIYTEWELALKMFNYYKDSHVFLEEFRRFNLPLGRNSEASDDEKDYMSWLGSEYPAFRPYYPPVSSVQQYKAEEKARKAEGIRIQVPGAKESAVPKSAGLPKGKTRLRSKRRNS